MPEKSVPNKYTSIPFEVLLHIAWRNIISKKLRSSLTILGVAIGIGAIFFLLSLGLGVQHLVTNEIIGSSSVKSVDITSPNSKIIKLNKEATDKIKNLPNVERLGNSYSFAGSLMFNKSEIDTIVYGIDSDYQELSKITVTEGRMLNQDDTDSVVINKAVLQAVGIKEINKVLNSKLDIVIPLKTSGSENVDTKDSIKGTFNVVGIIDSGSGSELYMKRTLFDQAEVEQFSQTKLIVNDTKNIPQLRKQIESMGFETVSPVDTIDQINQMFRYFNLALVGFGAIGMVVAILGMFNTLTISLLERTREIGLMVALGSRRKDMRLLFMIEAVLLSLFGSVFGILFAISSGKIANYAMLKLAHKRGVTEGFNIFATPLWLVLSLISFMVVVGLLVVLLPARRAEKINPIDALRRE